MQLIYLLCWLNATPRATERTSYGELSPYRSCGVLADLRLLGRPAAVPWRLASSGALILALVLKRVYTNRKLGYLVSPGNKLI